LSLCSAMSRLEACTTTPAGWKPAPQQMQAGSLHHSNLQAGSLHTAKRIHAEGPTPSFLPQGM
ncbi:MAG: hypothetical protein AB7K09_26070, partial [Planctomycetota bacterium]